MGGVAEIVTTRSALLDYSFTYGCAWSKLNRFFIKDVETGWLDRIVSESDLQIYLESLASCIIFAGGVFGSSTALILQSLG